MAYCSPHLHFSAKLIPFWKRVHTIPDRLFWWLITFTRNKYLGVLSCLAASSSIQIWFKPSLAILTTHYQICGDWVGTHRRRKFCRWELMFLKASWDGCWKTHEAMRQPGGQHGLFYPALSVFQIRRLWLSHSSFKFNILCSVRYFLAFSVIRMVSLWNSSALFIYCWDCGQQYWTHHFNSDCGVTKYMHVVDSALIQYYTGHAATFSCSFARSATRRSKILAWVIIHQGPLLPKSFSEVLTLRVGWSPLLCKYGLVSLSSRAVFFIWILLTFMSW